jgi:hypothetical protein
MLLAFAVQPAFKSRLYHNCFDDDFFQIDPTLGTNAPNSTERHG